MSMADLYHSYMSTLARNSAAREDLLLNTDKMDRDVADYYQQVGTIPGKVKARKGESLVDTIEGKVDSDNPMKGYAAQLRQSYEAALKDPNLMQYKPKEILHYIGEQTLLPRLEESYKYKRKADTSWFGLLGEDKSVKAPVGYSQWLEGKRAEEEAFPYHEPEDFTSEVAKTAGFGAAIGGAFGAPGGPLAALAGAGIGAIGGAASEAIAYPAREFLRSTEWYKARESSGSAWDQAKLYTLGGAFYAATGFGVDKALGKAAGAIAKSLAGEVGVEGLGKDFTNVLSSFERMPTGRNTVDLINATKGLRKANRLVTETMEEFTASPEFKQAAFDAASAAQYKELWDVASPEAKKQFTISLFDDAMQSANQARAKIPGEELMYGIAKERVTRKSTHGIPFEDIPDARDVVTKLNEESLDAAFSRPGNIGDNVLKAYNEQQALNAVKAREAEEAAIAARYTSVSEERRRVIDALLAKKTVPAAEKADKTAAALYKYNKGVEGSPFVPEKLGEKVAGVAARERIGAKPSELGWEAAPGAEKEMNRFFDELDEMAGNVRYEPVETFFHSIEDIKAIANKSGTVSLYHGMPTMWAESMVKGKPSAKFKTADDILRYVAKEYNIPYIELRNKTGAGHLVDSYSGQKVSRLSAAPPEVASRWAKSFPYGEILSDINTEARLLLEAKRRGITYDEMYELAGEAGRAAKKPGNATLADVLGLPDKFQRKGGSLVELKVDARSIPDYVSRQAQLSIKAVEEGRISPEDAVKIWNYTYKDIKIAHQNVKSASIVSKVKTDYDELYKGLGIELSKARKNPVGSAFKEAPEFVETEPGVFKPQKEIDSKVVEEGRKWIDAKKATVGIIAGIATAGLVPLSDIFGPKEAEAGVLKDVVGAAREFTSPLVARLMKGAADEGKTGVAEAARDANLLVRELPEGTTVIDKGKWWFKEQLNPWKSKATESLTTVTGVLKKLPRENRFVLSKLSPIHFSDMHYQEMYSVAEHLGDVGVTIQANTPNALKVFQNIVKEHPEAALYKGAVKEVNDTMAEFATNYGTAFGAREVARKRLIDVEKDLAEIGGKKTEAARNMISALESERTLLKNSIGQLQGDIDKLKPLHSALVEPLAVKHSGVRIALAAEDTLDYKKYPFLANIMTREDKVAAAKIKLFNATYADRIVDAGGQVIKSEPYIHHAMHPALRSQMIAAKLDSMGLSSLQVPFTKFYSRADDSLQLFPEINYIMQRYIPDAEKRIQYMKFWGEGNKMGWYAHRHNPLVKENPILNDFWTRIEESLRPPPDTWYNRLANRYAAFEVIRLIGGAPSVALKHLFKLSATAASHPVLFAKYAPMAAVMAAKNTIRNHADSKIVQALGLKMSDPTALEDLARTYVQSNAMLSNVLDFELNTMARGDKGFMSQFDGWLRRVASEAGFLTSGAEVFDRTMNILVANHMAIKQGLTKEQAIHGILGTVLRNNFMGGPLNPQWLRSPALRSLFIFQGTPFKIWERRLMQAYQTGRAVKTAWGDLKGEGVGRILEEMKGLKQYIGKAEGELKENLIYDAFAREKDILGTNMPAQLMKEILLLGTIMTIGGHLNLDFTPQALHLPFIKADRQEPGVTTAPVINALFKTAAQRKEAYKEGEEPEFYVNSFARNWMGKSGVIPVTFHKMMRISNNDIPDIYKDSPMKYFFAVPAKR